jgi:hypothetical protein
MTDEEPVREINTTTRQRLMQRSRLILVLGLHVGAVLDEEPHEIHTTTKRRLMQWSSFIIAFGRRVGAVLDAGFPVIRN